MVSIDRDYGAAVTRTTLRNLDLNLLPTLDALLRERNVTRAAERLGLSQPAVSAALGRLRRHFGDELLHRTGNQYELTPLAQQLRPPTELALAGVHRVFDASPGFDPASSDRTFRLMMSDYATAVLGERLVRRLAAVAPHVRLALRQTDPVFVDNAAENLRTVDGVVLPHGFLTDVPATDLFDDTWVCVVSPDNDLVGDELTMADLAALPWVVMWDLPTAFAPAARQLSMLGVEPRVEVTADSFLALPFLVAGTRRIAVLQARLAHRLAPAAGVRLLPCPWDVVPVKEALWWHPSQRRDPAHEWLRRTLREVGRELVEEAGEAS
jgi:DNA-binding transcriptional LysR family regulator